MPGDELAFAGVLQAKRVKVTVRGARYLGAVHRINPDRTLVLSRVTDARSGRSFPGLQLFFGHEILDVEFCGEAKGGDGGVADQAREGFLSAEEFQPHRRSLGSACDHDDDDRDFVNFEVVDGFHAAFGPAVMHIKRQRIIGLAADGVEAFQLGRLCWLQIATKTRVYLFDILLLGAQAFKNGLSMILQSKSILKVIHDCRGIGGSLLAQFGVNLTNVFDTQVADVLCFYSATGGFLPDRVSTLQEVLSLYLKVPASKLSSLKMKAKLTKDEKEMWYRRPCPSSLLRVMALSVIHLQPLRLVLLDALMVDYMGLVDSYLANSHREPGGVEHVSMSSVLELPRELRELEHMYLERRRYAMDHYTVTEQGLLARDSHFPQPPPEATIPTEEPSWPAAPQKRAKSQPPSPAQVEPLCTLPPPPDHPQVTESSSGLSAPPPDDGLPPSVAAARAPVLSPLSEPRKQPFLSRPMSPAVEIMGRGRREKDLQASFPALPFLGRGFILQIPPAKVPQGASGVLVSGSTEVAPSPRSSHAKKAVAEPEPSADVLRGGFPALERPINNLSWGFSGKM